MRRGASGGAGALFVGALEVARIWPGCSTAVMPVFISHGDRNTPIALIAQNRSLDHRTNIGSPWTAIAPEKEPRVTGRGAGSDSDPARPAPPSEDRAQPRTLFASLLLGL